MMRKKYASCRIIALFEPRSATARRNVFQDSFPASFAGADSVILKTPYLPEKIPADQRLDIDAVKRSIEQKGKEVFVSDSVGAIVDRVAEIASLGDDMIVLVMSNGGFDGIYDLLHTKLLGGR
jgi:UDP-N-acetylmuramate: L-alanyl-gamma-D-glutamyl-meso-diaminopimelate ligase